MSVVVKNALSMLFSQVGTLLMSSLLLVFVPGYFGEETFGKYTYAAVFMAFFGLIGAAGTGTYIVKSIARDRTQLGLYAVNGVVLKLTVGVMLSSMAVALGAVTGLDRDTMMFVVAAAIMMVATMVNEVLTSSLHGIEQMSRPATWTAISQVLAGAVTLAAIAVGVEPTIIVFLTLPTMMLPIVVNAFTIRRETSGFSNFRIRLSVWKVLAIGGFPFLLYQLILYAYGSVDLLMLRPLTDSSTVGWYSLAYRIISLPVLLAATVLLALFPSLSVQGVDDLPRLAHQINRALRFIGFISFPLAMGTFAVAPQLISTFYSTDFEQATALIRILALSMPIVVVDLVLGMALFATDRQGSFLVVGAIAAVLNPALNVIAIPYAVDRFDNGAIGAAVVTVLTELVIMFGALRLRPTGVVDRRTTAYLARCSIGAIVVVPAAAAADFGGLPTMILAGSATYFVASHVLKVIPSEELARLYRQFRHRSPDTLGGAASEVAEHASLVDATTDAVSASRDRCGGRPTYDQPPESEPSDDS